jgi:hypothetical protein
MNPLLIFGFLFLFMQGFSLFGQVTYLESGQLKVGILTGTGGRIVYFGLKHNGNILKSDTALWAEAEIEKPDIKEVNYYKAYHGNMVWPSPMGEWWTKQNMYPDKRKNADRWPPDPFLIYSEWKITGQMHDFLQWQSPDSPVSGIRITESVRLKDDSSMLFRVEFKNITDSVIHWGIWLNTALEGKNRCFVKVGSPGAVKIKDNVNQKEIIPWKTEDGFFTFLPGKAVVKKERIYTKACITPEINSIAAFSDNQLLIIKTFDNGTSTVHPEQSDVEIFNQFSAVENEDLLELEFHTGYGAIEPGQSKVAVQEWIIFPCNRFQNDAERLVFLNSKINRVEHFK